MLLSAEEKEDEMLRLPSTRQLSQKGAFCSKKQLEQCEWDYAACKPLLYLDKRSGKDFPRDDSTEPRFVIVGKSTTRTRSKGSTRYINR